MAGRSWANWNDSSSLACVCWPDLHWRFWAGFVGNSKKRNIVVEIWIILICVTIFSEKKENGLVCGHHCPQGMIATIVYKPQNRFEMFGKLQFLPCAEVWKQWYSTRECDQLKSVCRICLGQQTLSGWSYSQERNLSWDVDIVLRGNVLLFFSSEIKGKSWSEKGRGSGVFRFALCACSSSFFWNKDLIVSSRVIWKP